MIPDSVRSGPVERGAGISMAVLVVAIVISAVVGAAIIGSKWSNLCIYYDTFARSERDMHTVLSSNFESDRADFDARGKSYGLQLGAAVSTAGVSCDLGKVILKFIEGIGGAIDDGFVYVVDNIGEAFTPKK
jgi:hypothetical protein